MKFASWISPGVLLLTEDNAAPIGKHVGELRVRGQPHIELSSVRVAGPASFVVRIGVVDQSGVGTEGNVPYVLATCSSLHRSDLASSKRMDRLIQEVRCCGMRPRRRSVSGASQP